MTSDPEVRAVWEDWMLESGRALPSPRVMFGYGDGGGDGGCGSGDGGGYGGGGILARDGGPPVWRRRD